MNSTIKKLIVAVISFLVFTNVLLLRSWIWIINNEMMLVDQFEDFQRIQLEFSREKLSNRMKKGKNKQSFNLADKIKIKDTVKTMATSQNVHVVAQNHSQNSKRQRLTRKISKYKSRSSIYSGNLTTSLRNIATKERKLMIPTEKRELTVPRTLHQKTSFSSQHVGEYVKPVRINKLNEPKPPVANVYAYGDLNGLICNPGRFDTYALQWNPLFPDFPTNAGLVYSLEDKNRVDESNRKIIGFLRPVQDDFYEFQLSCTHFCDFILTDKDNTENVIHRISITLNHGKGRKMDGGDLYHQTSTAPVFLRKLHEYLFDITSLINRQGMYRLRWRKANTTTYVEIPSNVIYPFEKNVTMYPHLPRLNYFNRSRHTKLLHENPRNQFWNITRLPVLDIKECTFNESHLVRYPKKGEFFTVENNFLYPRDETIAIRSDGVFGASSKFLSDDQATQVVQWYMDVLGSNFLLHRIVHLESSPVHVNRYLVQVDVSKKGESTQSKIFRSTGWIHIGTNGTACRPQGFDIKPKKNIYLLTPVRNQRRWIAYFVKQLNRVVDITGEKNIHLIMVDYNSTDCNVASLLKKGTFKYTLLRQSGKFNKVKALNLAVRAIKEDDAIVFVFDLQLQFPLYLFDATRMHTFQGVMSYVPIMLRNACAEHAEFTVFKSTWSHWTDAGFGMIAMYKSDWMKIGGMNETRFGEKWGGEDWDLALKVLKAGIEISHHRLPGYYHLYHDSRGMWDGTKLY